MKKFALGLLALTSPLLAIEITVDPTQGQRVINPHIYGRNNNLRSTGGYFASEAEQQLNYEAGVKFMREGQGNNSSKYNWKLKLSSHPDWYNNVYTHDWDKAALLQKEKFPEANAMYSLQVAGYVATSDTCNFDASLDPTYSRTTENLACDGDISKYLKEWPADSTVGILDHWFGEGGLGLSKDQFRIWNLDNEPELWSHSHDDVYDSDPHPDEVIQKYIDVATASKKAHGDIELAGPAFTNDWQMWNWGNDQVSYTGGGFVEYYIKGMGEASQQAGVQLLDYVDFHQYPTFDGSVDGQYGIENLLQSHRDWYDEEYASPWANGIRGTQLAGWSGDVVQKTFVRTREMIDTYFGEGNTVGIGISEWGLFGQPWGTEPSPEVAAVWYASHLGTFADNGLSYFTPWFWYKGMYETLHLFTKTAGSTSVQSISDDDFTVTGYASLNASADTLTVILVNRDLASEQVVNINLTNANTVATSVSTWQLNDLPTTETFKGKEDNALLEGTAPVANGKVSLTLPDLSITAVKIPLSGAITSEVKTDSPAFQMTNGLLTSNVNTSFEILNLQGKIVYNGFLAKGSSLSLKHLSPGSYLVQIGPRSELLMVQ